MIQTHMLKLDPPYQIIHAGGDVGLHIATLVVTKESETEDETNEVVANCDHPDEVIANCENPQETSLSQYDIEKLIVTVRGEQVLIDQDIARIYGVTTGRLNQQAKRNIARFPESFRFQLTKEERDEVIANCDNLRSLKFYPSLPYAYTEQGIGRWMSLKSTIEYLGEWEMLYNPNFNCTEFDTIRNAAGSNNFVLSVKAWIERTGAIGIMALKSTAERYLPFVASISDIKTK